ncbi:beta-glucosidase [Desertihabitans aurantiacus]|uniref:beta-glucosidase n=1 Tax=Desertihabitans aurantiacus TaxID=2282477 RepID=UPI000DF81121|nr:beta-glucosidase [Desertihabitans aurantiacus]
MAPARLSRPGHHRSPGRVRHRPRGAVAAVASTVLLVVALAVLPVPTASAETRPWMDTSLSPDERAELLAAAMTLDQKVLLFSPDPQQAIPELGIPARREIDGATGVTTAPGARTTSFPAGLALASTWSPDLARDFGRQGGQEARLTGYSGWAAPAADLLRNPYHGRQWASMGEDPVLGGVMPAAVVEGINENSGVYSLPKHWLLNTQETQRLTLDNEVDERTLRELYVRQWEPLLAEGPGAVMCAFPRLRGEYSCENEHLLQDVLKGDLAFPGWVSSDFNACQSFDAFRSGADVCGPAFPSQDALRQAVLDGTISAERFDDMVHRILRTFFARGLIDDPPPGSLVNPRPDAEPLPADVVARGREIAYRIAVDGSVLLRNRGTSLPLEADELDSVAVIGEGADRYISGFGADFVRNPTAVVPILQGIEERAGDDVTVTHVDGTDAARVGDLMPGGTPVPSSVLRPAAGTGAGLTAEWFANPDLAGDPLVTRVEDQVNWGNGLAAVLGQFGAEPSPAPKLPAPFLGIPEPSVRWTGSLEPVRSGRYQLGVTVLGQARLWVDDELVLEADTDTVDTFSAPVELEAGERYDLRVEHVADAPQQCCPATQNLGPAIRLSWAPPSPDASPQIREAVRAARGADVAVVVANDYLGESLDRGHLGLPQGQDELIEAVSRANPRTVVVLTTGGAVEMPWLSRVSAVLEAWYPGQEQGRAVAALLFGDEPFTGRLPLSWPRSEQQVVDDLGIENPFPDVNDAGVTVRHDEGLDVGYRGYLAAGTEPLFPFGYGLTTGDADYRALRVADPRLAAPDRPQQARDGRVRVRVTNPGRVATTETVQVYQGALPGAVETPERQLLGWAEVTLRPRQSRWVEIPIRLDSPTHPLSRFDVAADAWVTPTGRTTLYVGRSVEDIELRRAVDVRPPPGRGR